MKKGKLLLLVVLMLLVCLFVVSCGEEETPETATHDHAYKYSITTSPTETAGGKATGKCTVTDCTETVTKDLPNLTDVVSDSNAKGFWTLKTTPATCKAAGSKVYSSSYGNVTIAIPKLTSHTFEAWEVTKEPTLEASGTATRFCSVCDDQASKTLPALTDIYDAETNADGFWTITTDITAGHEIEGKQVYESVQKENDKALFVVTKTQEALKHAWTLTQAPTKTEAGEAHCECGSDIEVSVLTDTTVWTWSEEDSYGSTYTTPGKDVYVSSLFGTVEVALDVLVAPYANKQYYIVRVHTGNVDDENDFYILTDAVNLNAASAGATIGSPFGNYIVVTYVNEETGEVKVTRYEEDQTTVTANFKGFYDSVTGIIMVDVNEGSSRLALLVPSDTVITDDQVKVSQWNNNSVFAISYNNGEETVNIFYNNGVFTTGVTFTDMKGEAVAADACFNNGYVYVKQGDTLIASFGHDGTKHNVLDGLEGTYTDGTDSVFVSGFGTLVYTSGEMVVHGTYAAVEGETYDLDVYLMDGDGNQTTYVQVTIGENYTYTKTIPDVTITYDAGEYGTQEPKTYNSNIPTLLPTLDHQIMVLVGWQDAEGKVTKVGEYYTPTASTTLTAVWESRCVITLDGVISGDTDTLYLYKDAVVYPHLPNYVVNETVDTANNRYFIGWQIDTNGDGTPDTSLPQDLAVEEGATAYTVYATWKEIPAYVGTYHGKDFDAWKNEGSNSYITIDMLGNVKGDLNMNYSSGDISGDMSNLNTETMTFTFGKYTAYVDATAGVVLLKDGSRPYGNDAWVFFKDVSEDELKGGALTNVNWGFYAPGSTSFDHRIIVLNDNGETHIYFIAENTLHANVTVSDAFGNALTTRDAIGASKTLVVKNSKGETLVAWASQKDAFNISGGYKTNALDGLQGSYTAGDKIVMLDGAGTIQFDDMIGTYTLNAGVYEVYLGDNTVYYQMTLDTAEKTAVMNKVMVTITFDTQKADVTVNPAEVNQNIETTLPTPISPEGYVFRGWYVEGEESTLLNGKYTPTAAVTLYAKWDAIHTVTIHYNDGTTADDVTSYGEGDTITIDKPVWTGHRFLGWYTTATFDEGSEWTSGTAMGNSDIVLYAKWGEPVAGYGTYFGYELYNEVSDSKNSGSHFVVTIDEEGNITGKFTGNLTDWDSETKMVKLKRDGSASRDCYFDPAVGILLCAFDWTPNFGKDAHVFVKAGAEDTAITMDHYGVMDGSAYTYRLLTYTIGDTTATILLTKNAAYVGVNAYNAYGDALAIADIAASKTVVFKQGETVIAKVASTEESFSGGKKTVTMDDVYGVYTLATSDVVVKLDGAGNIVYGDKVGTYALDEGNVYDVYFANGTEYYALTIDTSAKTCAIEKTMVDITFDAQQEGVTVDPVNTNKNIAITLPSLEKTGFVFRGWYVAGVEDTILTGEYVPTETVTLLAKWDKVITVTIELGNGLDPVVKAVGAGDDITALLAETAPKGAISGKAFSKWTVNGADYTPGTVTENTTIVCIWMDAVDEMGTYKSFEVWGYKDNGNNSGPKSDLVIDAIGAISGFKSGTVLYDDEGNAIGLKAGSSTYFATYVTGGTYEVFVWAYGTTADTFGTDMYIAFKDVSSLAWVGQSVVNDGKTRIVEFNADGTNVLVFVHEDQVYVNVAVTDLDGTAVTAAASRDESALIIKNAGGTTITTLVNKGNNVWVGLDGTEGTYTGALGNIVSTGAGTLTIADGEAVEYILDAGKLYFNYNNKYTVVELGTGTYTAVADGLAGTYTLPDGTNTYTLDGFGVVTGVGTYTYDGTTLTVYVDGGESIAYGIDGTNLLGKSAFAGLTFTGSFKDYWNDSNTLKIVFADAPTISGTMYCNYGTSHYFDFTGVLDGTTLTLTITKAVDSGAVNKTVVFSISGDTMTVESTTVSNNAYTFANEGSVKCDGFSL